MQAVKLRVKSNIQVSERYWHMVIDSSQLKKTVKPGQFFHIRCKDGYNPFLRRPLSVFSINKEEKTLEFLYLVKGEGTKSLTQIKAGEQVDIFGPLGNGFTLNEHHQTILLVARGVGIATLAALAQEAYVKQIRCIAILSARTYNDLLATSMLEELGVEIYKVTDEDGTSDVENVKQLVDQIIRDNEISGAYTCGSKRLSVLLQNRLANTTIEAEIALEEHMGCAMGVCFACVCDVKEGEQVVSQRVCVEGPVFPLEKVVLV